jgi:hypothetical protein
VHARSISTVTDTATVGQGYYPGLMFWFRWKKFVGS